MQTAFPMNSEVHPSWKIQLLRQSHYGTDVNGLLGTRVGERLKEKEMKRKDYAFWRQVNEKPSFYTRLPSERLP